MFHVEGKHFHLWSFKSSCLHSIYERGRRHGPNNDDVGIKAIILHAHAGNKEEEGRKLLTKIINKCFRERETLEMIILSDSPASNP